MYVFSSVYLLTNFFPYIEKRGKSDKNWSPIPNKNITYYHTKRIILNFCIYLDAYLTVEKRKIKIPAKDFFYLKPFLSFHLHYIGVSSCLIFQPEYIFLQFMLLYLGYLTQICAVI